MGMFDSVWVYMRCPSCNKYSSMEWQTKDLDNNMWDFTPLREDWETETLDKLFREKLNVFPKFPLDKEHTVWKNQAEKLEAQATIVGYDNLKYINCHTTCKECDKFFDGKIKIKDNKLREPVYDIVVDD